ncbi:S-layer family protein [Methanocaldococcus infernus ME]|uniref:S-layer family protein n=1 Tax=Methanocaldococcus infernus (strain DSM 11812 / JCM 15783 / ME) TaxID=573063 RepID=D5VTW1_METIM|nr:S-layer family protein [Methanocaldococcus infernus]ADG14014.1 S-layer family protein [Methanocaldococcus infernus ME]
MKKILFLLILLPLVNAYVIYVNTSTPDYENSKILLNELFDSREIFFNDTYVKIVFNNIYYKPLVNSTVNIDNLTINLDSGVLEYVIPIKENITINGKSYKLLKKKNSEVIYKGEEKEITTKYELKFLNKSIKVELISLDGNSVTIKLDNKSVILHKKEPKIIDNLVIEFCNYTKLLNSYSFTFKVSPIIILKRGEEFPMDKRFLVEDIKDNKIILKLKDKFNGSISINGKRYSIKKIKNNILKIRILYSKDFPLNESEYIDNNFFIFNHSLYYKDKEIKENKIIYLGEINPGLGLDVNDDIILIGGPVVNPYTKLLIKMNLILNISNTYPGDDKGLIIKIKNPQNPNHYIYILAGSNRVGTKKAINYFVNNYNGENEVLVK